MVELAILCDMTISDDISESKESGAKYRGLLEAAPDAMVVVNQAGEIVLLNVQAEKQFGYSRDELIGQRVKSIIPEGFAERLIADGTRSAAEVLAQQIGTGIELSGRRKDGSKFPIEIMLSLLESAEGILVTAAIRNISLRKDAEKHLAQTERGRLLAEGELRLSARKASEAKYRGLLEAAPDAMVVVNQGGEVVLLNAQAEKKFGYRRDELLGQKIRNIIPEGFAERLVADGTRSAAEALAQQIGTGIELSGQRKDGSRFPIEIMLSPLESAEGILATAMCSGSWPARQSLLPDTRASRSAAQSNCQAVTSKSETLSRSTRSSPSHVNPSTRSFFNSAADAMLTSPSKRRTHAPSFWLRIMDTVIQSALGKRTLSLPFLAPGLSRCPLSFASAVLCAFSNLTTRNSGKTAAHKSFVARCGPPASTQVLLQPCEETYANSSERSILRKHGWFRDFQDGSALCERPGQEAGEFSQSSGCTDIQRLRRRQASVSRWRKAKLWHSSIDHRFDLPVAWRSRRRRNLLCRRDLLLCSSSSSTPCSWTRCDNRTKSGAKLAASSNWEACDILSSRRQEVSRL
jgi:PAS domain S-box-containing protein